MTGQVLLVKQLSCTWYSAYVQSGQTPYYAILEPENRELYRSQGPRTFWHSELPQLVVLLVIVTTIWLNYLTSTRFLTNVLIRHEELA